MRKWLIPLSMTALLLVASGCSDGGTAQESSQPTSSPKAISPSAAATTEPDATASPEPTATPVPSIPGGKQTPEQAEQTIAKLSAEVIAAIKDRDMAKLQGWAHPDKGIRFSPYSHVDTAKDIVLNGNQLAAAFQDTKKTYTWGTHDGSGEPMELSFADYCDKFLYNHDYAKPEKTGYNESFVKGGNTANTIRDAYPDAILVEYYFSGFDTKVEGMDWASLTLVFEQKGDSWYVSGFVNNRWTI